MRTGDKWMPAWSMGAFGARLLAMAALWLILTGGDLRYWGIALIAVGAGALVSLLLTPSTGVGWSLVGWLRFIPFFVYQSVIGGLDVALRALAPTPRVDPVYVEYRLRLREEPARVLVVNAMSLTPGTLSVSLEGDLLRMHVLDRSMSPADTLPRIEEHAARMFRVDLIDGP